jgi:septal ring factor EnvC (AmiA/AmiB activator)
VPNIAGIIHIEPNTEERMAFLREDIVRAEYPDLDRTITDREERVRYLDEQIRVKKAQKRATKNQVTRLDVDIYDAQEMLARVRREINFLSVERDRLAGEIRAMNEYIDTGEWEQE